MIKRALISVLIWLGVFFAVQLLAAMMAATLTTSVLGGAVVASIVHHQRVRQRVTRL